MAYFLPLPAGASKSVSILHHELNGWPAKEGWSLNWFVISCLTWSGRSGCSCVGCSCLTEAPKLHLQLSWSPGRVVAHHMPDELVLHVSSP